MKRGKLNELNAGRNLKSKCNQVVKMGRGCGVLSLSTAGQRAAERIHDELLSI